MGQRMPSVPAAAGGRVPSPSMAAVSLGSSLVICTAELGAGKEVFVKLIKTTEARRKGKLISHGNQLDLIQKNKQRVRSVSLAGCFSGKGITQRFPPKGMALYCCSLCNWGFKSGTKSHYHKISLYGKKKKKLTFTKHRREQPNKRNQWERGCGVRCWGPGGARACSAAQLFCYPGLCSLLRTAHQDACWRSHQAAWGSGHSLDPQGVREDFVLPMGLSQMWGVPEPHEAQMCVH